MRGTIVIFCTGSRVLLERRDQRVSHLVIGDNASLLLVHHAVLLLLADQHHLDRLEEILLTHSLASVLDRKDGRPRSPYWRARSPLRAAGRKSDRIEIHRVVEAHPSRAP